MANLPLLAPGNPTIAISDLETINLSWEDHSKNETSYVVERAMQQGKTLSPYSVLADLPANSTSFIDPEVIPGVYVYYRVRALDADEASEYSRVVSVRTINRKKSSKDQLAESLKLYPNPANGQVTISTDMQLSAPVYFRLLDLQGVELRRFEITQKTAAGSMQLDVSGVSDGLYILQVTYLDANISLRLEIRH